MELWDAYDANGCRTGGTLVRGEPVPDGVYHLVAGILVEHADGTLLLMLRDPNKDTWPGVYEATSGGAALQGETPEEAARRELFEETGVRAETLIPLYEEISHRRHGVYRGFLCKTDCDKQSITLQKGETAGYLWATRDEVRDMMDEVPCRCIIQNGVRAYLGLPDDGTSDGFRLLTEKHASCRIND